MLVHQNYVSVLVSLILQTYHHDATSVCVLWNDNISVTLHQELFREYAVISSLYRPIFVEDDDQLIPEERIDLLTKFEIKLTNAIQLTHCESFVAFEEEIMIFVKSFMKSVLHTKWRSQKNKFLFIYTKGRFNITEEFDHIFFKEMDEILLVETINTTMFELKTTKFIGSRKTPSEFVLLDRYYGTAGAFEHHRHLYPDKLKNLMGRELISAAFAYEPFTVLKNSTMPNVMDVAYGNTDPNKRVLYDGTDGEILFHLCQLYNCTVQVDSSQDQAWGLVYENYTADGALGLVYDRKADIAMMAMYMWYDIYTHLDMSGILSRSGVTCLVPAPKRVISWLLPMEPFSWLLWLGIFACLTLETLGLLLTRWADRSENVTWLESAYFGYVTSLKLFVSQGCDYLPSSVSVRIVLFSCYMIDIIITSIYGGGLASILTIPTLEEAADSFERLAKHKLPWAATAYNWILAINGSDDPMTREVLRNFRVYSPSEIIHNRKVAKSIGFVTERLTYGHFALPDFLDQELFDSLKIMVDDIYYQYCVAFVPRSWALIDKFNNLLLMMHSSGLTQFLEWKVVADHLNRKLQEQIEASVKPNFDELGPTKLGMENFAGIIIILIIGIIVSILIFITELIYYRYMMKKDRIMSLHVPLQIMDIITDDLE